MVISITGPESSGKTTLAKQLANYLGYEYIPEFARAYLSKRFEPYDHHDFIYIAEQQYKTIQNALSSSKDAVLDTDLTVLKIWESIKFGQNTPWIEQAWKDENYPFFFLCKPDFPWEFDPLRENEHNRMELFSEYLSQLIWRGKAFHIIYGEQEIRFKKALSLILDFSSE